MAWTTPRTWTDTEFADAAMLNAHIRDNMLWLKTPPALSVAGTSDISTTSTTLVNITNMTGSITSVSGRLLVGFSAHMRADADTRTLAIEVNRNGVLTGGQVYTQIGLQQRMASFLARSSGAAGTQTVSIQWSTGAGTMYQDGSAVARRFFAAEWG